ncbi:MAG: membrane protein insertase YidC [Pseudohongiellaceae bacterium]
MDYTRTALIAALAIVSYMLLLAWNEDYPGTPQTAAPVETASTTTIPDGADLPDAPAEIPASSTTEDLPQVSQNNTATQAPQIPDDRLITITTPVQVVTIDLVGGDIVELALPAYPVSLDTPDDPFVLLHNNGGVYVAQSGLIGNDGPDASPSGRPRYQSPQNSYSLAENGETLTVDLQYRDENNVNISKRFTFREDDYLIDVSYIIENQGQSPWSANQFGQLKRDGSPDPSSVGGFGVNTYLGAALTTADDPYKKVDFGDIEDGGTRDEVQGGWIAFSQHYFLGSWIPGSDQTHTYTTRLNNNGEYIMGFVSPAITVTPGSSETLQASFWAGPKDQYRLEEIAPNMGLTIDYGWLWFIAYPIFWLLTQINDLIGNFGWSIVVLTIVIKLLLYRLSASSYRSMAKMRQLGPKITELKERHGDDKQKFMQAQMELWKKEKVNPMGGCLPMLLQMPIFIGIYWVLNESVELRHATWIFWYNDLSVMDPYFVLPLIMGLSMYISQQLTAMPMADPMQAKVMKFMPVVFTVFFLWFPAGLVLYWLVNNVFTIFQQWYITRNLEKSSKARAS